MKTRPEAPGPALAPGGAAEPGGETRPAPLLYVIATVHLDTQWRWTIQDTIRDFLPATLDGNFEIFQTRPFFVLSFEGAFRYMLVKEYYPERWRRLREFVRQGRWRVAGSMLDSPDVNIPSPESLIRHILYANRFFARELGRTSLDLFLPDCFGFGRALPSVAAHCGLEGFSAQKFGNWGAPAVLPFDLGRWEGPDGAGIVAALRPEGYGEGLAEDLSRADRWLARLDRQGATTGVWAGLKYVGIGDRGGRLDDASLDWLERSLRGEGPIRVLQAGSDQLFRDLTPDQIEGLQIHRDELLLPTHGTGCLTSQAAMKRWNRRNQQLAAAAETAASIADWLGVLPYPQQRLTDAWIRFLWHQMHDDLTGTSIPAAYRFSWNDQLVALNQFSLVLEDAVAATASLLDTSGEGIPLVVFNALAIARRDPVTAWVRFPTAPPTAVRVLGPDGRELPSQVLRREGDHLQILVVAPAPPCGFAICRVLPAARQCELDTGLRISERTMESPRYRVEIDSAGDLARVYDRRHRRELLAAPAGLELLADRSPRWPAWEIRYRDVQSPPRERVAGPAEIRVLEQGPARVCLEIRRRCRGSLFIQHVRLAAGEAGERLEVATEVDWRTRGRLLKASFPLASPNPRATYDLGLGVIERGNNRRSRYEVPAQQWADQSAEDGGGGVSVLNDSLHGWDKPDDRTLRLSLLRSPWTWRKFRHQAIQDFGRHRFIYALYGHAGGWQEADTQWQAARLNQPLQVFETGSHPGSLGRSLSFARTSSRQVAVRALKRHEDGSGLVIRLQELAGRPAPGTRISFAPAIFGAEELTGSEEILRQGETRAGRLVTDMRPFEPRTFRVALAPPDSPGRGPRSLPLDLPWDVVTTSPQGRPGGADFDGRGRSIPAELFPAVVHCAGVDLNMGPRDPGAANALACRGQSLLLPATGRRTLHLLAAAAGGPTGAIFRTGADITRLEVQAGCGFIGQWRGRRLTRPGSRRFRAGFIHRDRIGWMASHRHDRRGRDEPYVFCYLFHYRLEVAPDAEELVLPNSPKIRLFAATLEEEGIAAAPPAGHPYD